MRSLFLEPYSIQALIVMGNPRGTEIWPYVVQANIDRIRTKFLYAVTGRFQAEVVDRLQAETRELRDLRERMERKERRGRELKKKNGLLGEQHTALLEEYEASQEQVTISAVVVMTRKLPLTSYSSVVWSLQFAKQHT